MLSWRRFHSKDTMVVAPEMEQSVKGKDAFQSCPLAAKWSTAYQKTGARLCRTFRMMQKFAK